MRARRKFSRPLGDKPYRRRFVLVVEGKKKSRNTSPLSAQFARSALLNAKRGKEATPVVY